MQVPRITCSKTVWQGWLPAVQRAMSAVKKEERARKSAENSRNEAEIIAEK